MDSVTESAALARAELDVMTRAFRQGWVLGSVAAREVLEELPTAHLEPMADLFEELADLCRSVERGR